MDAPGRPLPQITPENEFFWTSGCRRPAAHPGVPELSGPDPSARAGVPLLPKPRHGCPRGLRHGRRSSAFTVNHRFGFPDLPPPYVVAQVAIEEDPRVRLTTNIIDCDPDDLELGQTVEVVFEQVADVWLPLFRPASRR